MSHDDEIDWSDTCYVYPDFDPYPLNFYGKLCLQDLVKNVDGKVARQFLGNYNLRNFTKENINGVKVIGNDPNKWLIVKHNIGRGEHTDRMSSFRRCAAACATYCIMKLVEQQPGKKLEDIEFSTSIDGEIVRNALADRDGIPDNSVLYYIYNDGLEFMVDFPGPVMALFEWKKKHQHHHEQGQVDSFRHRLSKHNPLFKPNFAEPFDEILSTITPGPITRREIFTRGLEELMKMLDNSNPQGQSGDPN